MTTHRIHFAEPGTGILADIEKLSGLLGIGYSYHNVSAWIPEIVAEGDLLRFLESDTLKAQLEEHMSLTLAIDGFEHIIQAYNAQELIRRIEKWTEDNPKLPINFHWIVTPTDAWRGHEVAEELLPLIAV